MTSLAMDRRSWAARLRLPRTTRRTFSERAAFLAFIAPNFMLFGVFFYPLLYNLYLSFTKWNMVSPVIPFVGVGNYVTLVHDAVFWKVLKNTFFLGIGSIAIRLVLALLLALVLNQRLTGRSLYRAVIFSPTFTTGAAIAIVWTWFLHKQFGLVRLPFDWIGLSSPNWLADVRWTLPAIILDQISAVPLLPEPLRGIV